MKTLEQLAREAGMVSLLDMGAASLVHSEGVDGVTADDLARFRAACRAETLKEAARECIALGKEHPPYIATSVQLVAKWCAAAIREIK